MKASDIYASPFLKGSDVDRPRKMTITEVTIETFQDQKTGKDSRKAVVSFAGAKKRLILNSTNAGALSRAFGDEMSAWPGRAVIVSQGQAPNGQPTVTLAAVPDEETQEGRADNDMPF